MQQRIDELPQLSSLLQFFLRLIHGPLVCVFGPQTSEALSEATYGRRIGTTIVIDHNGE